MKINDNLISYVIIVMLQLLLIKKRFSNQRKETRKETKNKKSWVQKILGKKNDKRKKFEKKTQKHTEKNLKIFFFTSLHIYHKK